MELKNSTTVTHCFKRAILMAFGDEPILRHVCMRDDGIVMIRNDKSMRELESGTINDNWIGWPVGDVYCYDPSAYEFLSKVYKEGKIEELRKAWATLEKFFA